MRRMRDKAGAVHAGSHIKEIIMNRRLITAGLASLAVLATPLIASGAMAKPAKADSHHVKKEKVAKKTSAAPATSSTATPATPAKK